MMSALDPVLMAAALSDAPVKVERGLLTDELMFVRLYAVRHVFMEAPLKLSDRQTLLRELDRHIRDSHSVESRDQFVSAVKTRCARYEQAFATDHPRGPMWQVGKLFAELCEHQGDLEVIVYGAMEFASCLRTMTAELGRYRVRVR